MLLNSCKVRCTESVRERERERSLPPLCNRRRVWRRRGREVVASASFFDCVFLSIVVLFTACGLSWFFPPLWVFHVTSCVLTLFLFSVYFVHTFPIRLWPNVPFKANPNKPLLCSSTFNQCYWLKRTTSKTRARRQKDKCSFRIGWWPKTRLRRKRSI